MCKETNLSLIKLGASKNAIMLGIPLAAYQQVPALGFTLFGELMVNPAFQSSQKLKNDTNNSTLRKPKMVNFIIGVIVGIVIATVGVSGVAKFLDKGVEEVKTQSKNLTK